ncbi:MAG: MoaD/ThiS family protein [Candidatus Bathyarchaeia archaeon]|nr:MoaD/ThiS family protein [Candidatus Bathyarchaeota archaeon]
MRVRVKVLGVLRRALGKDELVVDMNAKGDLRLKDIVDEVLREAASLRDILLDPELKDPRPNTIILLNGREINLLGGLDAIVRDGDEIVFIPVIHGG